MIWTYNFNIDDLVPEFKCRIDEMPRAAELFEKSFFELFLYALETRLGIIIDPDSIKIEYETLEK